jgi:hypothetical protein
VARIGYVHAVCRIAVASDASSPIYQPVMTRKDANFTSDAEMFELFDQFVRDAGGDPKKLDGKLIREMLHTTFKLMRDGADTGELKLVSRSLKELRYAMRVFRDYRDVPKVTIFGSARTPTGDPEYQAALDFGKVMAQRGWMIITGAGGGIMEAGHGGAGREASFGVAIRLPFETTANEFIEGDEKLIVFRYFFTRKLMFVSQSHAVVLFPGGFGTQDECYETLTLIQTGKSPVVPVVMVDAPGQSYWEYWDRNIRKDLLGKGMIDESDLNLYMVTDDVQAAADHIVNFYRNYHSQRFVGDDLVIRMRESLAESHIDALNEEFADLIVQGRLELCEALKGEHEHLDLPRIRFTYTRRDYGRLRMMIDRINAFAAAQ